MSGYGDVVCVMSLSPNIGEAYVLHVVVVVGDLHPLRLLASHAV